jgi:hypothetical protein
MDLDLSKSTTAVCEYFIFSLPKNAKAKNLRSSGNRLGSMVDSGAEM